jgi:hypothetical protein
MSAPSAFLLSRVQAEGWKAARSVPPSRLADLDDRAIDALNPYRIGDERKRWRKGFASACDAGIGKPSQTTGRDAGHE